MPVTHLQLLAQSVASACSSMVGALAIEDGLMGGALFLLGLAAAFGLVLAYRKSQALRVAAQTIEGLSHSVASEREGLGLQIPSLGDGEVHQALQHLAATLHDREAAMARERNKHDAILGSMADGILAVDAGGGIAWANQQAAKILGYSSPEKLEGRSVAEAIHIPELRDLFVRCHEHGENCKRRLSLGGGLRGAKRTLELRAAPLGSEAGGGCVLVISDRTELERLERVRRDFVANVSHELKTPLTSVRGYIETVRDDPEMPAELRSKFLGKSIRNADRLAAIIGDLLALARAEGDADAPKELRIELGGLARGAVTECGLLATEAKISIDLDAPQEVFVDGDRTALSSALTNLLENAIKYSPELTKVWVEVRRSGNTAVLAVEDRGAGIAPKHLDRIFERFYRIDKERSRELGGTGLGLSIVRNVALSHGGCARVTSTLGHGTRFWLELPVSV